MPKLTDTQLVILSAATQRDDRAALPLPKSLKIKGAAATKILDGLHRKGLLAELPAAPDTEAWRTDEGDRRMMLVITDAGRRAIDGGPAAKPGKRSPSAKTPSNKAGAPRKKAASKPPGKTPAPSARPDTKHALLIGLLSRKRGATIEEAMAATGWQAHSVRGAISGALKKKLGLTVTSAPVDGRGRVYRIAASG